MTNREIAQLLFNISTILADANGNPYRIRAYRRAARNLLRAQHQVAPRAVAGEHLGIPFLGKRLTQKITELALSGASAFYDELCGTLPTAHQALLHVPGIGPRLAERIASGFHTDEATALMEQAARVGLQNIPGIGPKRAALIMRNFAAAAPTLAPHITRVGNVLYVQENLWKGEAQPQTKREAQAGERHVVAQPEPAERMAA